MNQHVPPSEVTALTAEATPPQVATSLREVRLRIYRYQPDRDDRPWLQDVTVRIGPRDVMLLDVLQRVHDVDPTFVYRKSCREGVCGSDAMNVNGRNRLACITRVEELKQPIELRPLPGQPVIRDLIVDMTAFFRQYHSIRPWLVNDTPAPPDRERLQSPEQRETLDGLYECILCACCSTSCPPFWWHPDKFVGPAGLLQAYRFIADSRDTDTERRLDELDDAYRLFRCRTIMNCAEVCPKGLSPARAIESIRRRLVIRGM